MQRTTKNGQNCKVENRRNDKLKIGKNWKKLEKIGKNLKMIKLEIGQNRKNDKN